EGVQRILEAVGKLRKWDAAVSVTEDHKGSKFGFAQFDDIESLAVAIKLLHDEEVEVPKKRQQASADEPKDDTFEGIDKVKLQVAVDPSSVKYVESYEESRGDESKTPERVESARAALKAVIREMFYPTTSAAEGDATMSNTEPGENVEVVNIPLAQDDELADIPAEMREVVALEISAFRERSTRRDLERLRRAEEMEAQER
ncbi:hypothetical protein PC129_g25273, partial [Phytophthora cactorum]